MHALEIHDVARATSCIACALEMRSSNGRERPLGMAQCLVWIKSEDSRNFSVIHQNAFKLGHNIKHDDLNSLMALSVDKMGHVTYY